ncbi:hypothetical protein NECID01_0945 [Nematocida sp. AWRm77]|nr:hypothetical protein NECID01_0945 [Nematocida sp. AWRm77]
MENTETLIDKLMSYLAGVHRRSVYNLLDGLLAKKEVMENKRQHHRLLIGKAYSLAEDGDLSKAEQCLERVGMSGVSEIAQKYEIEGIMARVALKYLNKIEELSAVPGSSTEEMYEAHFLMKNYAECKRYGTQLAKEKPALAMMAMLAEHTSMFRPSVLMLLERIAPTSSLLLLLYKKGISFAEITEHIKKITCKNFPYYLLMKALLVKGEDLHAHLKSPAEDILEVLDDWEVYEYALGKNIALPSAAGKNVHSANYLRYCMLQAPTPQSIERFATSLEALKLAVPCIKQLSSSAQHELAAQMPASLWAAAEFYMHGKKACLGEVGVFAKTAEELVFFLGNLLVSKEESHLVSVLLLCFIYRKAFPSSFQVSFLLCVMYRYFLMYEKACKEYTKLDIHSVQLEQMSYLWSDLHILLGEETTFIHTEYTNTHRTMVSQINGNLFGFIEKEEYAQVLSLVELRDALVSSPIHKQISTHTITPSTADRFLQGVLVPGAEYVGRKLESKHVPATSSVLCTIDSLPQVFSEEKLSLLFNDAVCTLERYVPINRSSVLRLYNDFVSSQKKAHSVLSSQKQ